MGLKLSKVPVARGAGKLTNSSAVRGFSGNRKICVAVETFAAGEAWNEPAIGKAIWDLMLAMTANASLSDNVRQIAILVVGARFDAAYEICAHIAVAEREG